MTIEEMVKTKNLQASEALWVERMVSMMMVYKKQHRLIKQEKSK